MTKTKLERLTAEQEAMLPAFRDFGLQIGLSTERTDRVAADMAIRAHYRACGLAEPEIRWFDSPWASVRDSVGASVKDSVYGQHEAAWLAFYRFFRDECGLTDQTDKLRGLWELCQSCGWILPFENVCFASERHDVCKLDGRGVIHCEDGPAIHYRDGFSVHAWHGTRVPAHWIEDKASLRASEVLAERNVEVRMAGCQILGWAKVADQLDRRIIDGDPATDIGALVELTLPGLPEPGRFLMAQCPRNGTICEGVPRVSDIDGAPIETAIAAQAWRDALPASEYQHPPLRT